MQGRQVIGMGSSEVASISFGLNVDTSRVNESIRACASKVNTRMTSAFNAAGGSAHNAMVKISGSIDAATNKLNRQMAAIEAQRDAIAKLNSTLEQTRTKYAEQNTAIEEQKQLIAQLETAYGQLANSMGPPTKANAKEMERLKKQIETAKNKLTSLNQSAATTKNRMNSAADSIKNAKIKLGNMQTEADQTQQHLEELNAELSNVEANNQEVGRGMSGLVSAAKKAGAALAAAFAVKKIADFGAQCIKLGSDLAEVQNVVDVTFPSMSKQVDKFARDAAASFGLSETMAKKFTGTFGAMAKAFGFNEQAAYEMSTALTGLAGDVASFYNISQDEAYTKLKAVFSGETEVLKDLGIVMTQTALDAYAMANGYGKTTAKMSEAEKVALRYKFVQEQLTGAAGDFLRTSDGWANQVRVLQLQFDSLKATIGQGLINVLTPVIKVINTLIGKLMTAANAFKAFTDMITGKKSSGGAVVTDAGVAAEEAEHAKEALGGVAGAAKKAKQATAAATGIDELNVINAPSDNGGDGEAAGAMIGDAGIYGSAGEDETAVDNVANSFQRLIDKAKELAGIFKQGFVDGFANTGAFDSIGESIGRIKESLQSLFTSPEVTSAAGQFVQSILYNLGRITGSVASIGVTIAENLIGGFQKYLEQSSGYIKERLIQVFNAGSSISDSFGAAFDTIADVFGVFANEDGRQITADIIGIFADAGLGVLETSSRLAGNWADAVVQPIENNKGRIKAAVENTLAPLSTVTSSIHNLIKKTFSKVSEVFDTYIDPAFEKFKDGWNNILSAALDAYNTYLAPVLDWIADRFSQLVAKYVQPLMDAFVELWGTCMDAMATFWDFMSPFVGWMVEIFAAGISSALQKIWTVFEYLFSVVSNIITAILGVLKGLINFVVGVFTGDWERAWGGIKDIFKSIWDMIQNAVEAAINFIKNIVVSVMTEISNSISVILSGISVVFSSIWETIRNVVKTIIDSLAASIKGTMDFIHKGISGVLDTIKSKWDSIWNGLSTTIKNVFNGIWSFLKGIINKILGGIEKMANGVVKGMNKMIDALNDLSFDIPDWVPGIGGETFGFNIPTIPEVTLPRLAQGGFVKANTPQLAMIGDNRRYGEIVAPEDKMQEMVNRAVAMASQYSSSDRNEQYLSIMVELLRKIIELIENLDLVVKIDVREIRNKLKDLEKRTGFGFA